MKVDWKERAEMWRILYENEKGNATALFRYLKRKAKSWGAYDKKEWADWDRQYGGKR